MTDRQSVVNPQLALCHWPFVLCSLLLLACAAPALAQPAVPALSGRVIDQADILSTATENTLTALLRAHEDSTSNQVAVLTMASLEGASIESYSIDVAQTWGLGTAQNDNGVLLLVVVADREMRIEVGLGLEGDLTDVAADRIIRNEITPRFRSGDFDGGVLAGVQSIIGVIEGTYEPAEASQEEMPPFWVGLIFLLLPSVFAVIGVFMPGCFRWILFFFLMPFYWACGFMLTGSEIGGIIVVVVYSILYVGAQFHPKVKAVHKKYKSGIGSFVGGSGSSGSSSSSSWSSSSSSSSWSSSSSSSFSGGGGSFGGGGSSGSW